MLWKFFFINIKNFWYFIFIIGIFKHTNDLWTFFESFDTAIALAILALIACNEYAKNEDEIELKIAAYEKGKYDKAKEIFDFCILAGDKVKILRKEVTRGEILGLLGMFQKDTGNRYNLSDNKLILILLDEVKKVQKAKKNECIILILKDDYDKYFNPAISVKKEEKNNNDNFWHFFFINFPW